MFFIVSNSTARTQLFTILQVKCYVVDGIQSVVSSYPLDCDLNSE